MRALFGGRRRWVRTALGVLFCLPFLFLCGCGVSEQSTGLFAMDTLMELRVWARSGALDTLTEASGLIRELEECCSVTGDGELARLNAEGSGAVGSTLSALLSGALDLCDRTEGQLDITLEPVSELWGFRSEGEAVRSAPEENEIVQALARTGWDRVSLEEGYCRLEEGMALDLGAVAKGFAGDCLVELMEQRQVDRALFYLGGNVQTYGSKPGGEPWRVAVTDPNDTTGQLGTLEVFGTKSVVTSGGYQRYFSDPEGNVYHHILDPETGMPADSGLLSVTIVSESGLLADALSTALFVGGASAVLEQYRQYGDFEALLVDGDGTLWLTPGLADCFVSQREWRILE